VAHRAVVVVVVVVGWITSFLARNRAYSGSSACHTLSSVSGVRSSKPSRQKRQPDDRSPLLVREVDSHTVLRGYRYELTTGSLFCFECALGRSSKQLIKANQSYLVPREYAPHLFLSTHLHAHSAWRSSQARTPMASSERILVRLSGGAKRMMFLFVVLSHVGDAKCTH
jgi:hypothetical protein